MSAKPETGSGRGGFNSGMRSDSPVGEAARDELRQETAAMREIISATARHVNLRDVLDEVLHGTLKLTGLEGGTLCLINFEHNSLELAASFNTSPETIADLTTNRIQIGDCLCGNCAKDCRPLILWDNASGSAFATREATRKEGIRFHAAFPLRGRQRCFGVLCLFAKSERKPSERCLELVQDLCGPIALTIENTQLYEAAQREVAERRQAETTLRSRDHLLAESQRIAHIGTWSMELGAERIQWTEETYRIYGVDPATFVPSASSFLNLVHPEDRPLMERWIQDCVSGKEAGTLQFRIPWSDGTVRTLSGQGGLQHGSDGRPLRIVGTVQDITERANAEAELKRYREHLEDVVTLRTAELQTANRELEAFSYSVSHDLRAPLRAIRGFTSVLLEGDAKSLSEPGLKLLNEIARQADRMRQLIDDLLAFSRLGRQAMKCVPVDMDALAHEAFEAMHPMDTVQLMVHPLPPAFGDKAMLTVVWNNLLANAIKYSRGRNPALIEIWGFVQEPNNVYFVKDNGVGFDMQDADKLFHVFQRLHSNQEFEGTGVGLALVQRVIDRHGGRVWAEAKVDQGATFSFSLPVQKSS